MLFYANGCYFIPQVLYTAHEHDIHPSTTPSDAHTQTHISSAVIIGAYLAGSPTLLLLLVLLLHGVLERRWHAHVDKFDTEATDNAQRPLYASQLEQHVAFLCCKYFYSIWIRRRT